MPGTDLDLLIDAARAAGEIALGFTGPDAHAWDKPDAAGPVTEADIAVNDALKLRLLDARPDYGWLSEETEDSPERLAHEHVFIVDPIDGTRSFIAGSDTWAHSLAIARHGRVVAAVIYLPRLEKLYSAAVNRGAFLNAQRITARRDVQPRGASLLAARPVLEARHWPGGVPEVVRHYRPSLAYRLALVAEGSFDGMLTLRDSWEWDIAAGDLLLREAGAVVSDREGQALIFNNPHPVVPGVIAAASGFHDDIHRRLTSEE